MKNTTLLFFLLLAAWGASAQDLITRTNGDEISCHIVKITGKNIRYKPIGSSDTEIVSLPKRMVFEVKYQGGLQEVFNESHVDDNDPDGHWDKQSMTEKGKQDAWQYYRGYRGAAAGTFWTCFVTGGLIGLIPAIATSAHKPKEAGLRFPNPSLMEDPEYKKAYETQAHSIKTRKVWGAYVGGTILSTAAIIALIVI